MPYRWLASALFIITIVGAMPAAHAAEPLATPLPQAHAHNDYLHARPLLDALDQGFTSVEADVFLVDGDLWVAHTAEELEPQRTLRALYLEPLRARSQSQGGKIYPAGDRFQLLIDLKTPAEPTYQVLSEMLSEFADIITVVRDGVVEPRAVDVVVSGNRPIATMQRQAVRFAGVDGRLSDLHSDLPVHLMPLLSDRWGAHFQWRGTGPIAEAERRKLTEFVDRAHAAGRRIRFWATPETGECWQLLRDVGVDHINTDKLTELKQFLSRP